MRADARRNRARILDAAEEIFGERGPGASTEAIAIRAGVAIGTVFRHFPTKEDLLAAIMKRLLTELVEHGETLAADGTGATALYEYFGYVVERAAGARTVVGALRAGSEELTARTAASSGVDQAADDRSKRAGGDPLGAVGELHGVLETLVAKAREAGTVGDGVTGRDVGDLLTAACHGALYGEWDEERRGRALAVMFAGLRSAR
ncbi:helix-turn-helix domain-containing protein [Phytomonospora sp. NPDC050363]|uniref:TetR/AcrR family transcriptional regulator n=1 Tax=Phytomonospora sp. NPDC050363 TaxID=3155642 RepID=UPI00340038ED